MKNYRGIYNDLMQDLESEYNEMREGDGVKFAQWILDDGWDDEEEKELIQAALDGKGDERDIVEMASTLLDIYYNNRFGDEAHASVIKVDEGGIYILDTDSLKTFYIGIEHLNGTYHLLELVENMDEFTRLQKSIN